jgi:hypothetical protein
MSVRINLYYGRTRCSDERGPENLDRWIYLLHLPKCGYYAGGDGGDALYAWNGSSTCTDDGGSCIAPNSGSGRWILNNEGAVSVKAFGAHCDGSTDRTAKFKRGSCGTQCSLCPGQHDLRLRNGFVEWRTEQ